MNRVEINDNEIELVFENCECIKVSLAALESLRMTTRGERIVYEKRFGALFTAVEVDTIELKLKLKDKLDYRHGSTGQITAFGMTESIFTDGEKCMERIRTCNDLTHIYINGKCYQMPWDVEQGHPYTNLLQTTTKECTDSKEFITIAIKAKEAINEL